MIYVVTNRHLIEKGNLLDAVERVSADGADAVILREKDLDFNSLLALSKDVKAVTDRFNVPLIINGSIEIAIRVGAFGVQLGYNAFKDNVTFGDAKELGGLKLGVSVHSLEEAIEAEKDGVHHVIAGTVFETSCKPGLRGKGLEYIKELSENISIPVIGIGGISLENAKSVILAGANGVAVMSSAMTDYDGTYIRGLKKEISS